MTLIEEARRQLEAHSTTKPSVRFAQWVGIVTHPVLIAGPVAVASGVHELGWPSLPLMIMGVVTFFATIGLPTLMLVVLYRNGLIGGDIFLLRRENRVWIYPVILAGFALDICLFTWLVPLSVGLAMSWAGLVTALALFALNFITKISIHCAAVAAIFMGALTVYGKEALVFLPLIPLVVWARVTARNHTLPQALLGLAVGALSVWLVIAVGWPEINKMTRSNIEGYRRNPPAYWLPFTGRPQ